MREPTNDQGTRPMQRHAWAAAQTHVKPAPRWVLFYLADRAQPSGLAFPKVSTIAEGVGTARQQITGHLTRLEAGKLIERVRLKQGGQQRGYLFRVLVPGSASIDPDDLPKFVPDGFELPASWREPVPGEVR